MRNYQVDYSKYSFKAEDDWGCYNKNGNLLKGYFDRQYLAHKFNCDDGKQHKMLEHIAKWEYFNEKIPDGMTIDHIIPLSNGGTNKLDNLRLVSQADNNRNPLTRINHSIAAKMRQLSEETKKKISEAHKGMTYSEETKRKMSENNARYWKDKKRNLKRDNLGKFTVQNE